ncbi:hypothetical protein BDC45DRAFT_531866 [Circinella umbellata]|nr:hypothetical protein BDC45DRAFT_531866 [Circinella umbellata]
MAPTGFATLPSMAEVIELTTSFDRTLHITSLTRSHPLIVQKLIRDFHLLIEANLQDNDIQIEDEEDNHIIPQRRPFDDITSESELDSSSNEEEIIEMIVIIFMKNN